MNPSIRRHTELRGQCLLRQINSPASRRVAGRAVSARNTRESHNSTCTIVAYPFIPIINPSAERRPCQSPARPQPVLRHSLRGDWRPEHHVSWGNDQSRSDMQHVRAYSQPAPGRDGHGAQEADIHKPKNLLCRVPRKGGKRISLRAEWEVLAETGGMVETFDAAVSSAVGSADQFRRMEWGRHNSSSSTRGSKSSALFLAHDVERSPFRRAPQSVGINGDALLLAHLERMTSVQTRPPAQHVNRRSPVLRLAAPCRYH